MMRGVKMVDDLSRELASNSINLHGEYTGFADWISF